MNKSLAWWGMVVVASAWIVVVVAVVGHGIYIVAVEPFLDALDAGAMWAEIALLLLLVPPLGWLFWKLNGKI